MSLTQDFSRETVVVKSRNGHGKVMDNCFLREQCHRNPQISDCVSTIGPIIRHCIYIVPTIDQSFCDFRWVTAPLTPTGVSTHTT